jgi:hypothetical protein
VTQRVGLDRNLDGRLDPKLRVFGKGHDRRQFMNDGVGQPVLLHRIAAVFSHALAIGAAGGAMRDLADDLFDVSADPVRRNLIQNGRIGHHFPSLLTLCTFTERAIAHFLGSLYDKLLYDKMSTTGLK